MTEGAGAAPVRVRRARRADLPRIASIERRAFSQPWPDESFRAELAKKHSTVLVATDGASAKSPIVGYLCYSLVAGEFEVLNVAVDPAVRRRGVAVRLLDEAFASLRRLGASRGTLEVRRWNLPAIRLYERYGFRERSVRPNYYGVGEDALLMEISLV